MRQVVVAATAKVKFVKDLVKGRSYKIKEKGVNKATEATITLLSVKKVPNNMHKALWEMECTLVKGPVRGKEWLKKGDKFDTYISNDPQGALNNSGYYYDFTDIDAPKPEAPVAKPLPKNAIKNAKEFVDGKTYRAVIPADKVDFTFTVTSQKKGETYEGDPGVYHYIYCVIQEDVSAKKRDKPGKKRSFTVSDQRSGKVYNTPDSYTFYAVDAPENPVTKPEEKAPKKLQYRSEPASAKKILFQLQEAAKEGEKITYQEAPGSKFSALWAGLGNRSGLHSYAQEVTSKKWRESGARFTKKVESLLASGKGVFTIWTYRNKNRDSGSWVESYSWCVEK